jgi:Cu+-exporting ATPase
MAEKVRDPVCGMEVEKGNLCAEYQGRTYCFCSAYCKEKFEADPAQYAGSQAAGGGCG